MALRVNSLHSSSVFAFPAVKRGVYYNDRARLMSENAIISQTDRLIDTEGFLITDTLTDDTTNLEFVISGYYFSVLISDIISTIQDIDDLEEGKYLVASIGLQQTGTEYEMLQHDDESDNYNGLVFSTDSNGPTLTDMTTLLGGQVSVVLSLPILYCNGDKSTINGFELVPTSKKKLKRKSLIIDTIDGGEI